MARPAKLEKAAKHTNASFEAVYLYDLTIYNAAVNGGTKLDYIFAPQKLSQAFGVHLTALLEMPDNADAK